eukprot:6457641-Amphidinium_carterae.1
MEWPPSLLPFVDQAARDVTWAAELPALRDAVDAMGIEDVSDLSNMFLGAEEAGQHRLCALWTLAQISNRPDTHLVQAAIRAANPTQRAPQAVPPRRLRHVYQPRVQQRPRTTPLKLRPDDVRREDLAQQLISLSVSWAPHAGLAKGLTQSVAQRLIAQNSAHCTLAWRVWAAWFTWASSRGLGVLDNALQSGLVLDEFLADGGRSYSGRKRTWHALRWLQRHLAAPFALDANSMPQRPLGMADVGQRGQAV